jgi:ribose 5-phosphate isomerase B
MQIAMGSDHRGLELKKRLAAWLQQQGHQVTDLGASVTTSVDYPDFASAVAKSVAHGSAERGILVCGTGIGMAIAANKVPGIRATIVANEEQAELCRRHNNVNVLCLGEKQAADGLAERLVARWLETPFEGGRHADRVGKITALENCPPEGCS